MQVIHFQLSFNSILEHKFKRKTRAKYYIKFSINVLKALNQREYMRSKSKNLTRSSFNNLRLSVYVTMKTQEYIQADFCLRNNALHRYNILSYGHECVTDEIITFAMRKTRHLLCRKSFENNAQWWVNEEDKLYPSFQYLAPNDQTIKNKNKRIFCHLIVCLYIYPQFEI